MAPHQKLHDVGETGANHLGWLPLSLTVIGRLRAAQTPGGERPGNGVPEYRLLQCKKVKKGFFRTNRNNDEINEIPPIAALMRPNHMMATFTAFVEFN
ncbi:MAG: hypothetical protein CM1200mP32_06480 [Methanobacteriota archaeon]|nr:MAG: hypothetical protein CM1200mP32_06480 [Euryarchaeota archaeon]